MTKIKFFSMLFLMTMVSLTGYAGPGKRIMNKVTQVVELLEDKDETIACIMIDQLTKSSESRSFTRTCYSGNTYTAVAIGDANFSDIDMVVYRESSSGGWIQVGKDTDTSATALVGFDCNSTGKYKFEIKAYSFSSGSSSGYFGFALSYE